MSSYWINLRNRSFTTFIQDVPYNFAALLHFLQTILSLLFNFDFKNIRWLDKTKLIV